MVDLQNKWILILGGSSGLGLGTAKILASKGYHLLLIHRSARMFLEEIHQEFENIRKLGVEVMDYNLDATKTHVIENFLDEITLKKEITAIDGLVFSISRGNLKPIFSSEINSLNTQDFQLTLDAMSLCLHRWVGHIYTRKLWSSKARIIAFTSEGSSKIMANYAAVSVAKAALESLVRNMAVSLAPLGITCNLIQAGVCDTRSLRLIPDHEDLISYSKNRNPNGRLTTPMDVGNAVWLLLQPEADWINGTIIPVDGGESLC